ncbi:hypothetical protein HanXRQr2_Chr01g0041631 [Helianthus annuus]|uniref:Uncharacterized protein n=1 Tax=Helianthus annuus TaxID=4232 RepID=A0A9K3P521_HELAN|nr:hypothetical protein HanXRQr2_Chr01g0041631 [Helianthus annuus]
MNILKVEILRTIRCIAKETGRRLGKGQTFSLLLCLVCTRIYL